MAKHWCIPLRLIPIGHPERPANYFPEDFVFAYAFTANKPVDAWADYWIEYSPEQWAEYLANLPQIAVELEVARAQWDAYQAQFRAPDWYLLNQELNQAFVHFQLTPEPADVATFNGLLQLWGFPEECRISV